MRFGCDVASKVYSYRPGAGLALSLGCEGGLLFTVAHELLHSTRPLDKGLSNVLLCSVGYMHWTCSHLAHHRNVSPALAKLLLSSQPRISTRVGPQAAA